MVVLLSYCLLGMAAGPLVVLTGFSIAQRQLVSWQLFESVGRTTFLVASAFLGSALTYAASTDPQSAALVAWLMIFGLTLALVDWTCQRLPHFLVGTLFLGGLVLICLMAVGHRDAEPLLRAGGATAVTFVAGFLVYLTLGAGLGFGDVTLATALALILGWYGWSYVALGLIAGLVAAGVAAWTLLALGRVGRHDPIVLGPSLLLGTVFAVLQA